MNIKKNKKFLKLVVHGFEEKTDMETNNYKRSMDKEVCTTTEVQMISQSKDTVRGRKRGLSRVLTTFPGEISDIQGSQFLCTIVIPASFIYCSFLPVAPDFP